MEKSQKSGFHGEHFFEPLGGQMGLKIVTLVQIDDIQGVNLLDSSIVRRVIPILAQIWLRKG